MKKQFKTIMYLVFILVISLALVACSNNGELSEGEEVETMGTEDETLENEVATIRIGTISDNEPYANWIKEELEPLGYELDIIGFDAGHLPSAALRDGDVDAVFANQLHWIKKFNEENNTTLHMVEPYIYFSRMAVFSDRYNSLDELPENAQIAIPADATNMEHILKGLEKTRLITLGEKTDEFFSLLDIEDNPKNIEFIATERGTTARTIKDVDAVVCGSTEAKLAGIDVSKFLYDDFGNEDYPQGIVVKSEEDANLDWVKEAMKITRTDDFIEKFNNHYEGTRVLFD